MIMKVVQKWRWAIFDEFYIWAPRSPYVSRMGQDKNDRERVKVDRYSFDFLWRRLDGMRDINSRERTHTHTVSASSDGCVTIIR